MDYPAEHLTALFGPAPSTRKSTLPATWLARHIERDVSFTLLINGIGTGIQDSSLADTNRASRDTFVLNDIMMHAGDTITLRFDTVSSAGDFGGVNLNIAATPLAGPVREPSTIFFLASGLTAVLWLSRTMQLD